MKLRSCSFADTGVAEQRIRRFNDLLGGLRLPAVSAKSPMASYDDIVVCLVSAGHIVVE